MHLQFADSRHGRAYGTLEWLNEFVSDTPPDIAISTIAGELSIRNAQRFHHFRVRADRDKVLALMVRHRWSVV